MRPALTEAGDVDLWAQLPGQGKEILTGHLLVGRKSSLLIATIEDDNYCKAILKQTGV